MAGAAAVSVSFAWTLETFFSCQFWWHLCDQSSFLAEIFANDMLQSVRVQSH